MKTDGKMRPAISHTAWDLLDLVFCALRQTQPDTRRAAAMNQEELYRLASFHSLTALVAITLRGLDTGDMRDKWETAFHKAVRKTVLFDAERAALLAWMEEKQIWYVPLKGIILKELYPVYGSRQMADNDILFDAGFADEVRDWFVQRGYEAKYFGKGVHDSYYKEPVLNFEMHRTLFSESLNDWYAYFANIKDRLVKDTGNDFGYHFSDEDGYIYFFTHGAKHFTGGGTGLRSLIDLYLYATKKPDMDWNYIETELRSLSLWDAQQETRALAEAVFGGEALPSQTALSAERLELLSSLLSFGTYGTLEGRVINKMKQYAEKDGITGKRRAKLQYLRERAFPDGAAYRNYYAFFYRHWWARPLLPVYRFGKAVKKRRETLAEIRALIRA